jgi:Protein of unknown function (DUF3800)
LSAALYVYLDESGKFHDGSGYICLSGYLADDARLKSFTRQWTRLLRKYNLPRIRLATFFNDCRKRDFTDRESVKILMQFIDVIRRTRLFGFSVGVDGKHFRHALKLAGRPNQDPAIFAIHRILHQITEAASEIAAEKPLIMLTFDEDEEYSVRCYKLISRLRRIRPEVRSLIASISFAADDFFPPLQAADLLSNLTNKYWRDNMDAESPEPSNLLKRPLTEPKNGIGVAMWRGAEFWNAKAIDKNLAGLSLAKAMP